MCDTLKVKNKAFLLTEIGELHHYVKEVLIIIVLQMVRDFWRAVFLAVFGVGQSKWALLDEISALLAKGGRHFRFMFQQIELG